MPEGMVIVPEPKPLQPLPPGQKPPPVGKVLQTLRGIRADLAALVAAKEAEALGAKLHVAYEKVLRLRAAENPVLFGYEEELLRLLLRVDAVEIHDSPPLREARKGLVRAIQEHLTKVDRRKRQVGDASIASLSPGQPVPEGEGERGFNGSAIMGAASINGPPPALPGIVDEMQPLFHVKRLAVIFMYLVWAVTSAYTMWSITRSSDFTRLKGGLTRRGTAMHDARRSANQAGSAAGEADDDVFTDDLEEYEDDLDSSAAPIADQAVCDVDLPPGAVAEALDALDVSHLDASALGLDAGTQPQAPGMHSEL